MSKFYYEHNRVLEDAGWDVESGDKNKWLLGLLGLLLLGVALAYPYVSSRNQLARQKSAVVYVESDFATGTGFFVSKDGLILTNHHVVVDKQGKKSASVFVTRNAGSQEVSGPLAAEIVSLGNIAPRAEESGVVLGDWALLKLKAPPGDLPFLEIAKLESFQEGDDVLALGFPLGHERATNELGVKVSVKKGSMTRLDEDGGGRLIRITHKSGLDFGMSGGPLILKESGTVIGINTMGTTDSRADEDYALPITSLPTDILKKL